MEQITLRKAVNIMKSGKIFTALFIKRTTGEKRKLNGRYGVKKDLKGIGMAYDPKTKGLLVVWDMKKEAYRMIPLENLLKLKSRKQWKKIQR